MILGTGQTRWGYHPESRFVEAKDDSITIVCTVKVLVQAGSCTAAGRPFIAVPPPNMPEHLLLFIHTKRGCDVRFQVEGKEFEAHMLLMRMRAPSFSVQTLEPLAVAKGGGRLYATIADMKADAFEAVLCFIYTEMRPLKCIISSTALNLLLTRRRG
ncbi:hypothetical protein BAE44_0000938 [Dichanthelium oligosanthes]|uniref:BTB domain-containing protein n=1 Tax=Dichanthelium oligosanthes TaxID=888268 RepID=A0A1E5WL28_9POAL|nr:hypothetical protein BAE44_0000938 [Dichanthelium oligosanthes]